MNTMAGEYSTRGVISTHQMVDIIGIDEARIGNWRKRFDIGGSTGSKGIRAHWTLSQTMVLMIADRLSPPFEASEAVKFTRNGMRIFFSEGCPVHSWLDFNREGEARLLSAQQRVITGMTEDYLIQIAVSKIFERLLEVFPIK